MDRLEYLALLYVLLYEHRQFFKSKGYKVTTKTKIEKNKEL